jgi:hypothetical protein
MQMPTLVASEIKNKLATALSSNWRLSEEQFGFLVTTPKGSTGPELKNKLRDEAWRLARALGYKNFTSIEKTPEGAYLIYSKNAPDTWFQILVDEE